MDSAEQAALSESDHELGVAGLKSRMFGDYGDGSASYGGRGRDFLLKPMRRFDTQTVNLSLSSVLVPSGVDLNGTTPTQTEKHKQMVLK